nr:MAG TPA: putative cytoplasmic protein [Bacteriophage sp.]
MRSRTFVIPSYACPALQDSSWYRKASGNTRVSWFCPFCPNPYKKPKRIIYLFSILLPNHFCLRIKGQKRQKGQNPRNIENTEVFTPCKIQDKA